MTPLMKYITRYLIALTAGFLLFLALAYGLSFLYNIISTNAHDTNVDGPSWILDQAAAAAVTETCLSEDMASILRNKKIWGIKLDGNGHTEWTFDMPEEVPVSAVQSFREIDLMNKDYYLPPYLYIAGYPVFTRRDDCSLTVLGYPKGSYSIVYSYTPAVASISVDWIIIIPMGLFITFFIYYYSKRKILKTIKPFVDSIDALSHGEPFTLSVRDELSEVADSINKASRILSRQNEARANWINGISHDIRTPLSMIMGYTGRIIKNETVSVPVKEQIGIIQRQSQKIKDLISDLNIVSQLEYEALPIVKEPVHMAKLLRELTVELLNTGINGKYTAELEIAPAAEESVLACDPRLITRAVTNLTQNSIGHNPRGCDINISLDCEKNNILVSVTDDGVGFSPEKIQELSEKPHYQESLDERLDLRHGLGLLLVKQVAQAHDGTMSIENQPQGGVRITMSFPMAHA